MGLGVAAESREFRPVRPTVLSFPERSQRNWGTMIPEQASRPSPSDFSEQFEPASKDLQIFLSRVVACVDLVSKAGNDSRFSRSHWRAAWRSLCSWYAVRLSASNTVLMWESMLSAISPAADLAEITSFQIAQGDNRPIVYRAPTWHGLGVAIAGYAGMVDLTAEDGQQSDEDEQMAATHLSSLMSDFDTEDLQRLLLRMYKERSTLALFCGVNPLGSAPFASIEPPAEVEIRKKDLRTLFDVSDEGLSSRCQSGQLRVRPGRNQQWLYVVEDDLPAHWRRTVNDIAAKK